MNIKINCIYNDQGAWCKNITIKRSLFGLGARCCVIYPDWNSVCKHQKKYPKPTQIPPAPTYKAEVSRIKVGSMVKPKIPLGVWAINSPHNGVWDQIMITTGIFSGVGEVIASFEYTTDYSKWPEEYRSLNNDRNQSCLVSWKNGMGWVSGGALRKI